MNRWVAQATAGLLSILALAVTAPVLAADGPVFGPGRLDPALLHSFRAGYRQAGELLVLDVAVPEQGGVVHASFHQGVRDLALGDHIGHHLPALNFAYRKVAGRTLVRDGNRILSVGMVLDSLPAVVERDNLRAVDGTFAFWLLGLLPLQDGARVRLPVLVPDFRSRADFVLRDTDFHVTGSTSMQLVDGRQITAHVVENDMGGEGRLRTWVVSEPPYVLRQVMLVAGNSQETLASELLAAPPAD